MVLSLVENCGSNTSFPLFSIATQAHEDATDGFEEKTQPGYRYANITMKARPLSSVPKLQQLSKDLADLRKIPDGKWNIGIHPVL